MNQNNIDGKGIPLGFGMALAQNEAAFIKFSSMSVSEQRAVIDGVKGIDSKEEMQNYVNGLTSNM